MHLDRMGVSSAGLQSVEHPHCQVTDHQESYNLSTRFTVTLCLTACKSEQQLLRSSSNQDQDLDRTSVSRDNQTYSSQHNSSRSFCHRSFLGIKVGLLTVFIMMTMIQVRDVCLMKKLKGLI